MIGVVIAMQSEAQILLDTMKKEYETSVSGKTIYVGTAFEKRFALCVCGIGKVNASIGTQLLIDKFSVEKILNFGVAGGLNDGTELCNVYQIEKAVQFDFDLTQLNGTKIGTLDEYPENYLSLSTLPLPLSNKNLGTADRFNDSHDDFLLLTKELSADIRDMEACAIVQTAICSSLPVYSVKAISDVAGSGSTTEQYLQNRDKALQNLKSILPQIFSCL